MNVEMPEPRIAAVTPENVGRRIFVLRGEKVLLDSDLAMLYGVTTGRLNEQVGRNMARFPPDFAFRLSNQELRHLISQFATSNPAPRRGGVRKRPLAFTEHGAIMAASVLNTDRAIHVSVFVVRAFVRLRETVAAHHDWVRKLDALEKKTESLALKHDALADDTRAQFKQVIEALRQLMSPQETKRRPIGFVP
ncbi:MAG: ORF6N domain-containing protein [Pseudomonadota bacterium]|nr:ORF6N domain-containing protein [Pseudomonadota bacterium]